MFEVLRLRFNLPQPGCLNYPCRTPNDIVGDRTTETITTTFSVEPEQMIRL